jgi:hypothetical protein
MPLATVTTVKDQGNRVVNYRAPNGKSYNGTVVKMSSQPSAPATPGSSTSTSGGSLAAATYSYRLSRVVDDVESLPSTAVTQVTTGATSTVTVTWGADATAQRFKVYGRVGGSELLLATLPAGSTSWTDTGALTPAGALPTALPATAVHLRILGYAGGTGQKLKGGVLPATAEGQLDRYYVR